MATTPRLILRLPTKTQHGMWLMNFLHKLYGERYLHVDSEMSKLMGNWYPSAEDSLVISRTWRDPKKEREDLHRDLLEVAVHPRALASLGTALRAAVSGGSKEAAEIRKELVDTLQKHPFTDTGDLWSAADLIKVAYYTDAGRSPEAGAQRPAPK